MIHKDDLINVLVWVGWETDLMTTHKESYLIHFWMNHLNEWFNDSHELEWTVTCRHLLS